MPHITISGTLVDGHMQAHGGGDVAWQPYQEDDGGARVHSHFLWCHHASAL